jgi:hypothetical protein
MRRTQNFKSFCQKEQFKATAFEVFYSSLACNELQFVAEKN